jgi:hypothetical protein
MMTRFMIVTLSFVYWAIRRAPAGVHGWFRSSCCYITRNRWIASVHKWTDQRPSTRVRRCHNDVIRTAATIAITSWTTTPKRATAVKTPALSR